MYRSRRRRCALMAAVALCGGYAWADHFSATWSTNTTGSWTNASLWSTNPLFPNNGTDTFDAVIDSDDAIVVLDAPITINDFTLDGGIFTGGQTLAVNGTATWTSATIAGTGKLIINDTLAITGGDRVLVGFTIDIGADATTTWDSGVINAPDDAGSGGGGIINNAGLWSDSTDLGYFWVSDQTPVFNNTGTYMKTGTEDVLKSFFPVMNNDGVVEVQSGGIWFSGGGANTGTFNVAAGAVLAFSDYNQLFSGAGAPTTTFSDSSIISSQGTVIFGNDFGNATTEFAGTYDSAITIIDTDDPAQEGNDGRVTFLNSALVNSGTTTLGTLHVKSGTVRFETGQGSIAFTNGTFAAGVIDTANDLFFSNIEWSGGLLQGEPTMAEAFTNVSAGGLTFVGTDFKGMLDVIFFNGIDSHATIEKGELVLGRSSFRNLNGATFDFTGSANLVRGDVEDTFAEFINAGKLVKSAGDGVAELRSVKLINDGTVSVESGGLFLNGGGEHIGTFSIGLGAALGLGGGADMETHLFRDGSVINGDADSDLVIVGPVEFESGAQADVGRLVNENTLEIAGVVNATDIKIRHGGYTTVASGVLTSTGSIAVGEAAGGRLDVLLGATVDSHSSLIAPWEATTGEVNIEGAGSSWTTATNLVIANDGTATLSIRNQGIMQAGAGFIALSTTGVANVLVTDGNSQFLIDTDLGIGVNGTASVSIASGGVMSAQHAYIGDQATGIGSVEVDGTGSQFTTSELTVIGNFGSGSLMVNNGGSAHSGSHAFIGLNGGNGQVTVNGGTWTIGGGLFIGGTDSSGGAGELVIESGSHVSTQAGVRVWGGSSIQYNGGTFSAGAMELVSAGQVVLSPGGNKTLLTNSISITPFEESVLDLSDNKAIIDFGSGDDEAAILDQVRQYIRSGYNGGSWDGEQIITSEGDATHFALGYGTNSVLGFSSFGGYDIDANSLLIKYTYFGDANLDGKVNLLDLALFAPNWQSSGVWTDGDFDYNGIVNANDLGLLAMNWQSGNNAPLGQSLDGLGLPTSIPEPTTLAGWSLIGALVSLPRRRSRATFHRESGDPLSV